ncbi:hypothetical protein AKJ09_06776 [Labilithrix luteola]|uniref:Uncharacterized protein n=1 Tax=Labilithrix luteola TaxID=1391654 RepID=A0A0K1Q321_9BACT|nr:hypothetical protein AKJ09_06776 [Labilithrix luteola]
MTIHDVPSLALPRGQFLQQEADAPKFELVRRIDDARLWITAFDFSAPKRSAGPFEPHEAVRALRLANLSIPDGCELGPWQDGLGFFLIHPLPGDLHEWSHVAPDSLEPSVTRYERDDISGEKVSSCCAAPTKPPRVTWERIESAEPALLDVTLKAVHARHVELKHARLGALKRAWNGHPKNSLVWAPTGALDGGFYVADLELPEARTNG